MKKLCIYHGNCADGFTAAWAVRKKHPETEFHPGIYGQEPPACTGRDVIMVDFSYKRPVLLEIAKQAKTVLILDHHKSAEADLVDLPENVTIHFDMDRSGAMMAWEYFHPDTKPSFLIKHVQDRDLWRFSMEQTRAFQANLFSMNTRLKIGIGLMTYVLIFINTGLLSVLVKPLKESTLRILKN
jgi:hypothetical protein